VVEKRDIKSGNWAPVSDFCTNTWFTVNRLQEGHEYEFRVMAENALGRSEVLMTDKPVMAKDPFGTLFILYVATLIPGVPGKPGQPQIVDANYDHIDIKWASPSDDGGSPVESYDVERKDIATGKWVRVNLTPVRGTSFRDDRVQPNHQYEYRVVANNKAGAGAPSDPSRPIYARPMRREFFWK
jgi:hypothetical protein